MSCLAGGGCDCGCVGFALGGVAAWERYPTVSPILWAFAILMLSSLCTREVRKVIGAVVVGLVMLYVLWQVLLISWLETRYGP